MFDFIENVHVIIYPRRDVAADRDGGVLLNVSLFHTGGRRTKTRLNLSGVRVRG